MIYLVLYFLIGSVSGALTMMLTHSNKASIFNFVFWPLTLLKIFYDGGREVLSNKAEEDDQALIVVNLTTAMIALRRIARHEGEPSEIARDALKDIEISHER